MGRPVNTVATPIVIKSSVPVESFKVRERDEVRLSVHFNEVYSPEKRKEEKTSSVETYHVEEESVLLSAQEEPHGELQSTDVVVVNEMRIDPYLEIASESTNMSDSVVDVTVTVVAPIEIIIIVPVLVLEEVVPSTLLFYSSSIVSYNFFVVNERAYLRPIVDMLLDVVRGTVLLFGGWSKFMFSQGFPPGPPKKPPPWFVYVKMSVIFGTNILWVY